MRTHYSCHKQPADSVYCGYYVCEHEREFRRYTKDPKLDQRPLHNGPLHEQQLFFIVDDLCRFILHEVVHIGGEFVHPEHELSLDPKYASLRQWENQELRAGSTSVSQCK